MDHVTQRHSEKMKRIKAARDEMMMRCIALGIPCAVVQFIKGNWQTGEKTLREI